MSETKIEQTTQAYFQYGGFWRRFAAVLVDGLIYIAVFIAVFYVFRGFSLASLYQPYNKIAYYGFSYGFLVAYEVLLPLTGWQATPGRRLLGVYIGQKETGEKVFWWQSLYRYFVLHGLNYAFIVILFLNPTFSALTSHSHTMTDADQLRLAIVLQKQSKSEPVSAEELVFLRLHLRGMQMEQGMSIAKSLGYGLEDQIRYANANFKSLAKQNLTAEESLLQTDVSKKLGFEGLKFAFLYGLLAIYGLVIAFMVGLTTQKNGPHDLLAKTRVFKGRPPQSVATAAPVPMSA